MDLAGPRTSVIIDDLEQLQSITTHDMRIWGFQICTEPESNMLTSFRLLSAEKYGTGYFIDLNPIGPGEENCTRYALGDPVNEPV